MKKLFASLAALGTTSFALAQTADPFANLAGLGIGGILLLGVLIFVLWRFFAGGGD